MILLRCVILTRRFFYFEIQSFNSFVVVVKRCAEKKKETSSNSTLNIHRVNIILLDRFNNHLTRLVHFIFILFFVISKHLRSILLILLTITDITPFSFFFSFCWHRIKVNQECSDKQHLIKSKKKKERKMWDKRKGLQWLSKEKCLWSLYIDSRFFFIDNFDRSDFQS